MMLIQKSETRNYCGAYGYAYIGPVQVLVGVVDQSHRDLPRKQRAQVCSGVTCLGFRGLGFRGLGFRV